MGLTEALDAGIKEFKELIPKKKESMIDLNVSKDEHVEFELQTGINGKKVIYLHVDGVTKVRINIHQNAGFRLYDSRAKEKVK